MAAAAKPKMTPTRDLFIVVAVAGVQSKDIVHTDALFGPIPQRLQHRCDMLRFFFFIFLLLLFLLFYFFHLVYFG